jgi:phytoene desaturase
LDYNHLYLNYLEANGSPKVARSINMKHHRRSTDPKEILIIGAGLAGLASGARLAKLGHRVTIHEGSDQIGGKCRTMWIDGYGFDTGPSLLTLPAVYRDLFLKTGGPNDLITNLQPVNPAFCYRFPNGKNLIFPNLSHSGVIKSIAEALGNSQGEIWNQLLLRAEAMWDASRETFIEGELRGWLPLLRRKNLLRDLRVITPFKTLRELTLSSGAAPEIVKIIDRYATYTGSDPRKVPAVLLTIAFLEEAFGAWHIPGGLGQLPNALASRFKELGGTIKLNSTVSEIIIKNGRAAGVFLSTGEKLESDIVISNVDSKVLYRRLVPRRDRWRAWRELQALANSTTSFSGFSLLLALDGVSNVDHHTVLFPENYDAEFDAIFKDNLPPSDPTIYICNPRDRSLVPDPNSEAWFVLINAPLHQPNQGFDWDVPGLKERYAELILSKIEERGIDIRNRIKFMKIRTPADLERETGSPGGSIYGPSSNGLRSAFLRARNRSPIKNLYCVGGSAHPGGGLPLVAISAEIVANSISELERV